MKKHMTRSGRLAIALGTLLAVVLISSTTADAQDVPKKLKRQMHIVESLLSEVLIDSPYWLVNSGGHVNGFYQDEYGAIFTLEVSLVGGDSNFFFGDKFSLGSVRVESHGNRVVVYNDDEDDDIYWEDEDDDDDDDDEDDALSKKYRSRRLRSSARRYEKGKAELRETLIDYGESLAGLKENQWVTIAACLSDHRYFRDNKISRLILKAKVKDLRAHGDGNITFDEMNSRIVEEVY